jgi:hypothetical protein
MEAAFQQEKFMEALQGVYRLFRVASFHSLGNDAVEESIQRGLRALHQLDEEHGVLLLFTRDTVLVNGRLLPMPPETWETALALKTYLDRCEINSIWLGPGVDALAMRRLLLFFRQHSPHALPSADDAQPDARGFLAPGLRVRKVANQFLVGLESPDLDPLDRGLLTYALAVRVIRQLRSSVLTGSGSIPPYFKRVARQLTRIDFETRPEMLDVTVGHDADDPSAVAVDAALVALAAARRITSSEEVLTRVVLSAMTVDLGLRDVELQSGLVSPDEVAMAHLRVGQLRSDAASRTIVAWEARTMLRGEPSPDVYSAHIYPTLEAYLIALSRRFVEAFGRASRRKDAASVDRAIQEIRRFADTDIAVMVIQLISEGLFLLPRGLPVQLAGDRTGIVLRAGRSPSRAGRPAVRLLASEEQPSEDIDLDEPFAVERWGVAEPLPQPWPVELQRLILELEDGKELEKWLRMVTRARAMYARRRGLPAPTISAFESSSDGVQRTTGNSQPLTSTSEVAAGPLRVTQAPPSVHVPANSDPEAAVFAAGIMRSRKQTTGDLDRRLTLTEGVRFVPSPSFRKPGEG